METIKDFSDPKELFTWLVNPSTSNHYYFRGINRLEQMYPTIMRINGQDLSFVEDNILQEFMRYGSSLIGSTNNAFDCVAYAQHFGLPTRLVDWTRNPLVALFFSIYNAQNSDNQYTQLLLVPCKNTMPIYEPVHRQTWNELELSYRNPIRDYLKFIHQIDEGLFAELCISTASLDDMKNTTLEDYSKNIKENDAAGMMIMIDTQYSNPRILAQDGLFYMPRRLVKGLIDKEYSASGVTDIKVPVSWRLQLLDMMKCVGISKYRLFFDLQTICGYIVDQVEDSIEEIDKELTV